MSNYLRLNPHEPIVAVPLVRDVAVSVGRDEANALHMYATFDASYDNSRSNVFGVDVVVRPGTVCAPDDFDPAKHPHDVYYYHSNGNGPAQLTRQMADTIGVVMERNQVIIRGAHNRLLLASEQHLFRATMNAVAAALGHY